MVGLSAEDLTYIRITADNFWITDNEVVQYLDRKMKTKWRKFSLLFPLMKHAKRE